MKRGLLSALAIALAVPAAALASDEHQSARGKKQNSVVAQANTDSTSTKTNGKTTKKARNKKVSKSGAKTSKSEVKTETSTDTNSKK